MSTGHSLSSNQGCHTQPRAQPPEPGSCNTLFIFPQVCQPRHKPRPLLVVRPVLCPWVCPCPAQSPGGDHATMQGAGGAGAGAGAGAPPQPPLPPLPPGAVCCWPRPHRQPATRSRGFEGRAAAAGPQLGSCSCHAGCGQLRAPAPCRGQAANRW